jgi:hypothetical protein
MANASEVLLMLCPGVEYTLIGDKYEDIDWLGQEAPLTKKQFTDGFAKFDAWQAEQNSAKAAAKTELLDRLGITAEEAKLLLA